MELPIPKHLKKLINPIGNDNSEFQVTGKIECECGNDEIEINLVGDDSKYREIQVIRVVEIENKFYLIIKVECKKCNSEYLLFDKDYHGWNGYVCGGDNREVKRPKTKKWNCDNCGNSTHEMTIKISSEGKDDFMEEGGDEFGGENWVEGFGWITFETKCVNCRKKNPEWISYETM